MTNRGLPRPRTEWAPAELEADRRQSIEHFRHERMTEPLEQYLDAFEEVQDAMDELLESTVDLTMLEDQALEVLTNPALLESFRYLTGPPISLDDLKVLVDTNSLIPAALLRDPDLVRRLVSTVRAGLDRRRFPWVAEGRAPTEAERTAAVLASAALIATQRVATARRTESKVVQEALVRRILLDSGFRQIPTRQITSLVDPPDRGEFCVETLFGTRKADLVVRLWDGRMMPIECKVSNSATNSVKRLNNDAAVKAEVWRHDFGQTQVVPVAVLSGVYNLKNLQEAQRRGLTLYWAHRISDLATWIELTRPAGP